MDHQEGAVEATENNSQDYDEMSSQEMGMAAGANESLGAITCDPSVFRDIALQTARKIEGIVIEERSSGNIMSRKDPVVAIETTDEYGAQVRLRVNVLFGKNVYEVCTELQRRVKDAIETITNYSVRAVNIEVLSLVPNKDGNEHEDVERGEHDH